MGLHAVMGLLDIQGAGGGEDLGCGAPTLGAGQLVHEGFVPPHTNTDLLSTQTQRTVNFPTDGASSRFIIVRTSRGRVQNTRLHDAHPITDEHGPAGGGQTQGVLSTASHTKAHIGGQKDILVTV